MMKLSHKRVRDLDSNTDTPMTVSCSPNRVIVPATSIKRMKCEDNSNSNSNSPSTNSSSFQTSQRETHFPPLQQENENKIKEDIFKHQQRISKSHSSSTNSNSTPSSPSPMNNLNERLFSYTEVREIINRVLAEREAVLRAEYDNILQDRLQEQYRNFAKFNEDYISRQLKQSDFSYLS